MTNDDAMGAVAELAASQHGAFTRRQAAELGITKVVIAGWLRRGLVREPARGVLVLVGAPATFRSRLTVATLAGNGTVASHRASGLLHGMDPFDAAPLEVLVQRGRYPAIDGVVVHRATPLDERDLTVVDGIPTTTVVRTLCDLGAVVHQDVVEQCVDWALRNGFSEPAIRDAYVRLHRPGPSGTSVLGRVLDDPRRAGQIPQTWFERIVQRALAAPDLPPLQLQHVVRGPDGRKLATLDGAWPEWKIGIEAHSAEWHDRPGRVWRDLERDNVIKTVGWAIVYVTYALAQQPDKLLDLVREIHRQQTQQ